MPTLSPYAYESQFNVACKSRLRAAGVTNAFHARDLGTLPDSRIVVESSGFARASGHMSQGQDGQFRYDHHAGTVTFIITTPRTATGREQHDAWLGLVRETFLPARRPLDGMPYQIMRFEETSGSVTYIQDGERDRSELVFSAEFGLRPGT